jgi:predicted acylesterase/phospholipase RssA
MIPAFKRNSKRSAGYLIMAWIAALALLSLGCNSSRPYHALPGNLENQAQIPGLPDVRDWADVRSKIFLKSALESLKQEKAANHGKLQPVFYALALSGGGGDGAFGAGLLCGWSETGTMPAFKLVTGISVGALLAPFAFLGPAYVQHLKQIFTTISDKDIYTKHNSLALLLSLLNIRPLPSMNSTKPLARLIKKWVTPQMLEDIAAEQRKGRRLIVGSTQVDAQREVIWDLTAIAASNYPHKLELFRKILLASSAIPARFPPQFFTVAAGGRKFQEMHVDGGVRVEVLLYEDALESFVIGGPRPRQLYIILNNQVAPVWKDVRDQLKYVGSRAIKGLIKAQGIADLYRLYVYAQRDGIDYHLAYIPKNFPYRPRTEFDKAYMNQLFYYAYNLAKKGYPWSKYPPHFNPVKGGHLHISPLYPSEN